MTAGEAIINAISAYWASKAERDRDAALSVIRIITDCQEDMALIRTSGEDGAS